MQLKSRRISVSTSGEDPTAWEVDQHETLGSFRCLRPIEAAGEKSIKSHSLLGSCSDRRKSSGDDMFEQGGRIPARPSKKRFPAECRCHHPAGILHGVASRLDHAMKKTRFDKSLEICLNKRRGASLCGGQAHAVRILIDADQRWFRHLSQMDDSVQ